MKVLTICGKDLTHAFRSLFGLMFMFGIPFLLTGLFYFAFNGGATEGPVGSIEPVRLVIIDTGSTDTAAITGNLFSEQNLQDVLTLLPSTDETTALAMLAQEQTDGVLRLPQADNQPATLMVQKANTMQALVLRSVVASVLDAQQAQQMLITTSQEGLPINDAVLAAWQQAVSEEGPDRITVSGDGTKKANILQQIIPTIMSGMLIFFAFFTAAYGAQSILTEEQHGTLQRMFITGSQRRTILAGKFLAVWVTIFVQVGLTLLASGLLFKIAWGNGIGQFVLSIAIATAAAGFGILLVSFLRSQREAGFVMSGAVMISGFIGISAVFTGSGKIGISALCVPQGWALQGLLSLQAADSLTWLRAAGGLLLWGLVLFMVGKIRFDRRYAREA